MHTYESYAGGEGVIKITIAGDGFAHLNIYSQAKTELGRRLSNFSKNDFVHPEYGWFQSVEGYWYWCSTGKRHEKFRAKWGMDAKQTGRGFSKEKYPEFEQDILDAIHLKLAYWPDIHEQLLACKLPLVHYYLFGGTFRPTKGSEFILDELDLIRKGKPLKFKKPE